MRLSHARRLRSSAPLRLTLSALCLIVALQTIASADVRPRKGWLRLQSPNFLVIGDVGARDLRQVAERLERFRDALGMLLPKAVLSTSTPTTVVVFKSHKSYEPLKPIYQGKPRSNTAGFFQPGQAINYVTVTLEGGLDNLGIIYHEYVHLLVNNNVSSIPVWFNEGLAEYYRTFEVNDAGDRAIVGRVQSDHVLLLREQFLPLPALVAVDHESPLYNESSKASIFYAESWALVHYLILGEEQKFAKNATAFAFALGSGKSLDEAARGSLGVGAADLEKGLRRYVTRSTFYSQRFGFTERVEKLGAIQAAPIDEADVHAALGDLLLQMDRREDAKAELTAALTFDGANGAAHASLGMLDVRESQWDSSRTHFERAISSPSASFLSHYYYGVALAQTLSDHGSPNADDLAAMERAFRRAIELNPGFADAYAQLAWAIGRQSSKIQEAGAMMIKAMKLSPGREDYQLGLGTLLANAEDFDAAKQVLTPLAVRAVDEKVRSLAQERLNLITSYEKQRAEYEKQRAEWEARNRTTVERTSESGSGGTTAATVTPRLRELKSGETRYSGRLTSIECGPKGVVLVVKVDAETVRARAQKFDAIEFITYRDDTGGRIECGVRKSPQRVLLTLQLDAGTRLRGVAVAAEFVPDDFEQ